MVPSLVVVEDFEQFLSEARDPQRVLNTLDGVETPDNPAGTLLLATSNAPEKIDVRIKDRPGRIDLMIEIGPIADEDIARRFLKRYLGNAYESEAHGKIAGQFIGQTGSHIQQACLLAAIHALDEERANIVAADLEWAHAEHLKGREAAANDKTCAPSSTKKNGLFGFQ